MIPKIGFKRAKGNRDNGPPEAGGVLPYYTKRYMYQLTNALLVGLDMQSKFASTLCVIDKILKLSLNIVDLVPKCEWKRQGRLEM